MKNIYLDNAATTLVDEQVLKKMLPYFSEKYGNSSSTHSLGEESKRALEESRRIIARSINAKTEEIIFTSGGTEANNLTLKGIIFSNQEKKHVITTKIEHDCILNASKWLETREVKVTYLNVDEEGFIDLEQLKNSITEQTALVSIIHGNNEIGTIQDIKEIGRICKEKNKKNILFHIDACQSFTKTAINVKKQNLDLISLNSHKIHGPKGVGALYIKEGIKITPLAHGGGHEKNLRSGTENISGIVGFAEAVKTASEKHIKQMTKLRDYFIEELLKLPSTKLNGSKEKRLCNNINICFKGIDADTLGGYLNSQGICSSVGSACSSHNPEPSHVLLALGMSPEDANSSIRFSISKFTTKRELDYVLEVLPKVINEIKKINKFF